MAARIAERKDEAHRMHKVRTLAYQSLPFAKRFANKRDLPVFEVSQATVNDAGRAAGGSGGEVVLFEQKDASAAARTLPRDGDSVDSASNDYDLVAFLERRTWRSGRHPIYDAK